LAQWKIVGAMENRWRKRLPTPWRSGVGAAFGEELGEVVLDQLGFVFFVRGSGDVAVVVEVAGEFGEGAVDGVEFDRAGEAAAVGFAELFELALVGEAAAEAGLDGVGIGRQFGIGDWGLGILEMRRVGANLFGFFGAGRGGKLVVRREI